MSEEEYALEERRKDMKKRILSAVAAMVLCAALVWTAVITGCSGYLTEEQEESILKQYAAWMEEEEPYEAKYLPYQTVASWRLFGTETDGEYLYIYADILDQSYVLFEKRAYSRSGGHMPVRIRAKEEKGELKLIDVDYPEDGDDYWESIKAMYPRKYFLQYRYYYGNSSENLYIKLEDRQEERLKEMWGGDVQIERENLMDIEEDGSYRIWNTTDGPAEEFEVIVIKEGKL